MLLEQLLQDLMLIDLNLLKLMFQLQLGPLPIVRRQFMLKVRITIDPYQYLLQLVLEQLLLMLKSLTIDQSIMVLVLEQEVVVEEQMVNLLDL